MRGGGVWTFAVNRLDLLRWIVDDLKRLKRYF